MKKETYISVDVETTGPIPGLFAMIELGASVVGGSHMIDYFSMSLELNPEDFPPVYINPLVKNVQMTGWHADTWNWWNHPDRIDILTNLQSCNFPAHHVMQLFAKWIGRFENPVLVGFPAAFDFQFVHYYWWKYMQTEPPFGWRMLDIKTLAMLALGGGYKNAGKRALHKRFPTFFDDKLPHTHRALDDAREQGLLFANLLRYMRRLTEAGRSVTDQEVDVKLVTPQTECPGCPHPRSSHSDLDGCYECDNCTGLLT